MTALTGAQAAEAVLPDGARIAMALHDGRDQVACALAADGWDAFEAPLPRLLFRAAQRWPGLIADVGANTGFYTLLGLAAHARNVAVACEPVPDILAALDANLRMNGVRRRARLIRCAIGDANGPGTLYLPHAGHGLIETSASMRADFKDAHERTLDVLQRTLDRVLLRPSWLGRRVRIVKIDAEGFEAAVLRGACWTVRLHRPLIFIEILDHAEFAALDRFLARFRYEDVPLPAAGVLRRADKARFRQDAWNHAFVPREMLDGFLAL